MLAPAVARPMASVIGRPLARLLGTSGRLGRENSMRSPRRTAQTASALMVGLALVSAIAVFGASLSQSATSSVDNAISADLIVSDAEQQRAGQTSATPCRRRRRPSPGSPPTSTVYGDQFEFQGSLETLTAVSTQNLSQTVILNMTAGTPAALAAGELLIDTTTANSDHLSVGDIVPVRFALTGRYHHAHRRRSSRPTRSIGKYLVGDGFFLAHFQNPLPGRRAARRPTGAPGCEQAVKHGAGALPERAGPDPGPVRAVADGHRSTSCSASIYALLALAVIIALIGIVNTLMLSVFERTHEIGLLRAVGMKRRQIRAMIRSESVILAVFGAVIGIIVGTGLGHRPRVVVALAGHHRHGRADLEPGDLPHPGRPARPARRRAGRPGAPRKLDVLAAIAAD